jgi:GH18 family chitinase
VNIDVEGTDASQRDAFSTLVGAVSHQLHAAHPTWQVTVDTYVGSATNPQSFFDVAGLARSVDALFVMAYDMYGSGAASPNSPLAGYRPNVSDAVAAYSAAVSPGKVILGLPFYGYDWVTVDDSPASRAVSGPRAITWATIRSSGWAARWDGVAQSPWASYQLGGQWHEAYYDDAQSLGAKAAAASAAHLRGVGVWALGMDGGDPSLLEALAAGGVSNSLGQKGVTPPPPPPSPQPGSAQPPPAAGGGSQSPAVGGPTQQPPAQARPASSTTSSSTTTTTGPPPPSLPIPTTPTTVQCKALFC